MTESSINKRVYNLSVRRFPARYRSKRLQNSPKPTAGGVGGGAFTVPEPFFYKAIDDNGVEYIRTKYTIATTGGVSMYADDNASIPSIFESIPLGNGLVWEDGKITVDGELGGGTMDHNDLLNRNAVNQHSISAITGLQAALDAKSPIHSHPYRSNTWMPTAIEVGALPVNSKAADSDKLDNLHASDFSRLTYGAKTNLNELFDIQSGVHMVDGILSNTPISTANMRILQMGTTYRGTQVAFDWISDRAFFRRKQDSIISSWKEFYHTGNLYGNRTIIGKSQSSAMWYLVGATANNHYSGFTAIVTGMGVASAGMACTYYISAHSINGIHVRRLGFSGSSQLELGIVESGYVKQVWIRSKSIEFTNTTITEEHTVGGATVFVNLDGTNPISSGVTPISASSVWDAYNSNKLDVDWSCRSLIMGDSDSGFMWHSDGLISARANGVQMFNWNSDRTFFDRRIQCASSGSFVADVIAGSANNGAVFYRPVTSGYSWNSGNGALTVDIASNDSQTPLLLARRVNTAGTGADRLFAIEQLNSGGHLYFQQRGTTMMRFVNNASIYLDKSVRVTGSLSSSSQYFSDGQFRGATTTNATSAPFELGQQLVSAGTFIPLLKSTSAMDGIGYWQNALIGIRRSGNNFGSFEILMSKNDNGTAWSKLSFGADGLLHVGGSILADGGITMLSDMRLKDRIERAKSVLPSILDIDVFRYTLKADAARRIYIGVSAQQIQGIWTEFVHGKETLSLDYAQMAAYVAIKGLQETKLWMDEKDQKIVHLEKRIVELENNIG